MEYKDTLHLGSPSRPEGRQASSFCQSNAKLLGFRFSLATASVDEALTNLSRVANPHHVKNHGPPPSVSEIVVGGPPV
jgi:hypothetical protein